MRQGSQSFHWNHYLDSVTIVASQVYLLFPGCCFAIEQFFYFSPATLVPFSLDSLECSLLVVSERKVHRESDCYVLSQLLFHSLVSQASEVGMGFHLGALEFMSSGFCSIYFFFASSERPFSAFLLNCSCFHLCLLLSFDPHFLFNETLNRGNFFIPDATHSRGKNGQFVHSHSVKENSSGFLKLLSPTKKIK